MANRELQKKIQKLIRKFPGIHVAATKILLPAQNAKLGHAPGLYGKHFVWKLLEGFEF
jgi:hypothetical protein